MTTLPNTTSQLSNGALARRKPLLALCGAVLAAVTGSSMADAGKGSKKERKRARQRADKLCRRQVEGCRAAYIDMCGEIARPQCFELRDAILECCDHLADCQAGETLTCISTLTANEDRRRIALLPR